MDFLRLAIATTGLAGSLRESLGIAAGSGAQGVQFDLRQEVTADEFGVTACQELRHLLDERSLKIASATFPLRRPLHDPVEIDGRVNVVRKAIELCGRLHGSIHYHIGKWQVERVGHAPAPETCTRLGLHPFEAPR